MDNKQNLIACNIDIPEEAISDLHPSLLRLLIKDKTTHRNILWCTKEYESNGVGFMETDEINIEYITGLFRVVIQPRAAKTKEIQSMRIRTKAEVFTPSWVCNEQNNLVDDNWFGRKNVFNIPSGTCWIPTEGKIVFETTGKKTWKAYVEAKRLEITCGEAPYLVSRYDTTTGALIPVYHRIGLLDRKMRVVNENCETEAEWLVWAEKAMKSIYGYEFQGDSLLIARENLLYDYIDYYRERFGREPDVELLKDIANIIAWNIWQMDGLKGVVPYSCHNTVEESMQLSFDIPNEIKTYPCPGCVKNNLFMHNGIRCRIMDWTNLKKSIEYVSLFQEGK